MHREQLIKRLCQIQITSSIDPSIKGITQDQDGHDHRWKSLPCSEAAPRFSNLRFTTPEACRQRGLSARVSGSVVNREEITKWNDREESCGGGNRANVTLSRGVRFHFTCHFSCVHEASTQLQRLRILYERTSFPLVRYGSAQYDTVSLSGFSSHLGSGAKASQSGLVHFLWILQTPLVMETYPYFPSPVETRLYNVHTVVK